MPKQVSDKTRGFVTSWYASRDVLQYLITGFGSCPNARDPDFDDRDRHQWLTSGKVETSAGTVSVSMT